jgi:hypothetical protein
VGIVIVKDEIIEAVLERCAVYFFLHKDGNIVILILIPEVEGHNLGMGREYCLDLAEHGFGEMLLHDVNALFGRVNASATMVSTSTAVASASRASVAVTFRPW